jgi:UDP-N-acetylmuramoyl-L-alanyl-D-glutamate--2,6-diaminopimelate ligase
LTKPAVPLLELVSSAGLDDAHVVPAGGRAAPSAIVKDVASSSDEVTPGALFACIKGQRADGHDFASTAVERGAVALLCERPLAVPVAQVVVPSVRKALGPVSARLWSHPSSAMKVVGVTGTNGKTTTCALLAAVFEAQGWRPGVIGTLTGTRTTPEAPALQRQLAQMRERGALAVAMEVSSHALDQYRVGGTRFSAAVFTNLSQDHLDYHRTMEAYFEAKARLFSDCEVGVAVVNRSDPWGAKLAERLRSVKAHLETFSPADATQVVLGRSSASFSWRGKHLRVNMTGRFNVENAVAAATAARALGVSWEALESGLAAVAQVRGRFEPVDLGQPFEVLVDYAHTPAALTEALNASRERARGRVIAVFGAGGDRDRDKRPAMGKVASELSDIAVITSDNPRSEDPGKIIEELVSGAKGPAKILVDPDRKSAIAAAVSMAAEGDVVLIAGKGHETGQDFGAGRVEPFDDVEVAREAIAAAGYSPALPRLGAAVRQSQSESHPQRSWL